VRSGSWSSGYSGETTTECREICCIFTTNLPKRQKTVKNAEIVHKRLDILTRIQYNRVMIKKELKNYMTVYLDMDGVIADFFKAFAEANGKTHWKDVEDILSFISSYHPSNRKSIMPNGRGTPVSDVMFSFVATLPSFIKP